MRQIGPRCVRLSTALAAIALGLTACDDPLVVDAPFSCSTSDDCGDGQECLAGVCMTEGEVADALGAAEALSACPAGACDDGDPCTEDLCSVATGCSHGPATDGTACDDGSACTTGELCKAGKCGGGQVKACDDGEACTVDGCDAATGCTHVAAPLVCDDGDACTVHDVCEGGKCAPGAPRSCDDAEVCTADGCDPNLGCKHTPADGPCDDGDPCTEGDACAAGACKPGKALPCECVQDADCAKLDDGDPCTGLVVCGSADLPGKCTLDAGTIVDCDDSQDTPCLKNGCDPQTGHCAYHPVKGSPQCDDGDACTQGESCAGGACGGGKAKTCDDGEPCTLDSCAPASGCVYDISALDGKPCDADGSVCTIGDACKGGACLPGQATPCDDGNACTADDCDDKGGCAHPPKKAGAACDDGDACTIGDTCAGGACEGGAAKSCDGGGPCTVYACDTGTGQCTAKPAGDGAPCGGGQGACSGGACVHTDSAGRKWGLVPAGTFFMGCNAVLDKACKTKEKPQHEVVITKPFWIGVHEVTVAEYKACVEAGKCTAPSTTSKWCSGIRAKWNNWPSVNPDRLTHPVNCVDWSQSKTYCGWAGGFLPTEAQWELAARGRCEDNGGVAGCASKMPKYPWGAAEPVCGKHAVFGSGGRGCGKDRTWKVGAGSGSGRSPYGPYDMAGNVWEWVRDAYVPGFYQKVKSGAVSKKDPVDTSAVSPHVMRGGGFEIDPPHLRAAARGAYEASTQDHVLGLRCARPFAPCDDANPCTSDAVAKNGACTHAAKNEGAACDDGDPCTGTGSCKGGVCAAGEAVSCDDGNGCTVDLCSATLGCVHQPTKTGAACDDGDACTASDACEQGVCAGKPACDDGEPCTADACAPKTGKCAHAFEMPVCCAIHGGKLEAGARCIRTGGKGRKQALVPAGRFFMGCNAAKDSECADAEKPQHEVELSSYWIDLFEVTADAYAKCVAEGKCEAVGAGDPLCNSTAAGPKTGRGAHPANCIKWPLATAYCKWAGGDLPTEAQWEKAARGGCEVNTGGASCAASMRVHPWGDVAPSCGVHAVSKSGGYGCGKGGTWPVGTGSASGRSPYGPFDMTGNVGEWTRDTFDAGFYAAPAATEKDPMRPGGATAPRVLRGGAYNEGVQWRASQRGAYTPDGVKPFLGFRCVSPTTTACDDGDPCTLDAQGAGGTCTHPPAKDGTICEDGDRCTTSDACKAGTCLPGKALSCDDGNACTEDLCDSFLGCVHKAATPGKACDDGDGCMVGKTCADMTCKGGKAKTCDDGNPCTVDACNPKTGECGHKGLSYSACCQVLGGTAGGACVWTDKAGRKWGLVPAGTFWMGCNPALDTGCKSSEMPQHKVVITKPFWLGIYEVTVDDYKACVAAGACAQPAAGATGVVSGCKSGSSYANWNAAGPVSGRGSHPLNCVTWARAEAYCAWAGGGLPTEAQWELAARGRCEENGGAKGCASKMRVHPWGNAPPVCGKHAVFSSGGWGCGDGTTWPVGSGSAKGVGPYGHRDLAGNVWEWVWDYWDIGFYGTSGATAPDPKGTKSSSNRVDRGGSFASTPSFLRSGNRVHFAASFPGYDLGARCARPYP